MSYGEAIRLTSELSTDPESRVAAALAGWEHALPRAAMVAMDAYDLAHHLAWAENGGKGQRPKPYPRPWTRSNVAAGSYSKGKGTRLSPPEFKSEWARLTASQQV